VKVAQYEVLGMKQKDTSVPSASGTIETFGFWSRTRLSDCQHSSIVPFLRRRPDFGGQAGTDSSFKTLTQLFVLGYFRQVPTGPIFPTKTCVIPIASA
jgi:hypothetical protein